VFEKGSSISADPDEIAVVSSASAGINAIASALRFTGDRCRVVLSDMEFPTMPHVWLAQQERGAQVCWVRADGRHLDVGAYAREIDDRTLIVPATHVCFRNGVKLDIGYNDEDVDSVLAALKAEAALLDVAS
jgi:selenocysteine lyase/cysteine desulfurase